MSPLAIMAIIAAVLGSGVALEGWLLLNAHERIGDLKAESAAAKAVIAQKNHDADLSLKLADVQTSITNAINGIALPTQEVIRHVPINVACTNDPAFVAAAGSVQRLRQAGPGPRRPSP